MRQYVELLLRYTILPLNGMCSAELLVRAAVDRNSTDSVSRDRSACECVCVSVGDVCESCRMAERIEMLFGRMTRGPKGACIRWGSRSDESV